MYYLYYGTYVLENYFCFWLRHLPGFCSEFLGAFIAAGLVYGTYYDAINQFDGGVRQVKILILFQ
jgi:glycerol uptake facilitator-like aquaporin